MFNWFKKIAVKKESAELQKESIEPVDSEFEEKTVVDLINEFGQELEFLKKKVVSLEKNQLRYNKIIKELIETVLEVTESSQTTVNNVSDDNPTTNLDDAKLQLIEHKVDELRKKYDSVLDILADKLSENDKLPNLFVGDISLKELWRKHPDKKDMLLYSIAYMMKKEFEEKGVKIR